MVKPVFERIPADLRKKSVDLRDLLGVDSFAWYLQDALKVVEWCRQNHIPILGGDVIEKSGNGDFSLTYDNWYQNIDSSTTLPEFTAKSVDYTIQKINFYAQKNESKELLFDLVFKK